MRNCSRVLLVTMATYLYVWWYRRHGTSDVLIRPTGRRWRLSVFVKRAPTRREKGNLMAGSCLSALLYYCRIMSTWPRQMCFPWAWLYFRQ